MTSTCRSLQSSAISLWRPSLKTGCIIPRSYVSCRNQRYVHVKATPSTTSISPPQDLSEQTRNIPKLSGKGPFPQTVSFEVLGAPHSLLSVALPASSTLYTRRGTLVGATSNDDLNNAVSTLSMQKPLRRALLGVPFLYQTVSSTTPMNCLIATNTPNTTFAVVELDGAVDWMVTQRKALLAWTGHSLTTKPSLSGRMSPAHWSTSRISGRGLVALVGKGQVYQVVLQDSEEMIIHPNNLLAYSLGGKRPKPYRLAQTSLRFQVPRIFNIRGWFPRSEFLHNMSKTSTYQGFATFMYTLRSWTRRTIWGDRLFLKFQGPTTILIQSRAAAISDVLTKKEIDDIATTKPGALDALQPPEENEGIAKLALPLPTSMKVAVITEGGKVSFEDSDARPFITK